MIQKKILLAYITRYSGHHQAASAIIDGLDKLSSGKKVSYNLGNGIELVKIGDGVEILKIDFLKHLHRFVGRFIEKAYLRMLKKNPQTWEYLYDNPEVYSRLEKWIDRLNALKSWRRGRLTKLIDEFKPDIICCTQAFPALMLANYKEKQNSLKMFLTPIVGVLTDYHPHRYWVHCPLDLYVVPSEEAAQVLAARGIEKRKIRNFGIPIDPTKFFINKRVDKKAILRKLGLADSLPVVLVMGGGQGLGFVKEIVENLNKFLPLLQLIVVCGQNRKLQRKLARLSPFLRYPIKILGYVENINELMKISSLLITKPGGLTVSESLACGLPMIIINPLPGQETLNAQFLTKNNLAVAAADEKEAIAFTLRLLNNPKELEEQRSRLRNFAKPDAALFIAYSLIKGWA